MSLPDPLADGSLALQLGDSEVSSVARTTTGLCIRFAAAQVVSRADQGPMASPELGYVRGLEIVLLGTLPSGPLDDLIGRLHEGTLYLNGQPVRPLPVPWHAQGALQLTLAFANGAGLQCAATEAWVRVPAGAAVRPSFHC